MVESRAFTIYSHLPVWAQNVACSLAGFRIRRRRYNRTFREFLSFLNESQWWSLQDQKEYQNEKLRIIVRHAYETIPYYREVMSQRKLCPSDIKTTDDLPKLPILTKDILRKRHTDLISSEYPNSKRVYGKTGGTTGKSLVLISDAGTQPRQWAVWWRHRMRFGLELNDEFIVFAGRSVIPLSNLNPPFWRRNWPLRQTYVSIHHMTEKNMAALADYLIQRQVKYYSGYPSGVYLVAKYLLDNNIRLPHPPEIVTLGAETLLPHQQQTIAEAFNCDVTDQYGASEQCGNISDCEHHHYHADMEFGAIEFLPLSGVPANVRRIVCSGFWNFAMPLIRYDIGDIATLPETETECPCGRKSPIVERIDGRIESYIITSDGRQLGRLDFLFKDTPAIEEAQLVQERISEVAIRLVCNAQYSTQHEKKLLADCRRYLGDSIQIHFEYLEEIPRSANGKFRQIISTVFKDKQALQAIQESM